VSRFDFSEQQLAAIELREGPLALAANAGSGKTSVLVERFARAVLEDAIAPARILAITFTDRAAGELRARVRARLLAAGERDAATAAASAYISTFHAFAARVLRSHPLLSGLAPDFVVLNDGTTAGLRAQAFQGAITEWLALDGALDLGATFGSWDLETSIGRIYDERRSRGELVPQLPALDHEPDLAGASARFAAARDAFAAELAGATLNPTVEGALARLERCRDLLARGGASGPAELAGLALGRGAGALCTALADAYRQTRDEYEKALADRLALAALPLLDRLLGLFAARFRALKADRGGVDYDDLELLALELLREHPDVAASWRARFELLMVDELQDTNPRQMEMLTLLERENLFTVGDSFQSIYGFRHADVTIFRERFERLHAADRALVLPDNFRSRRPILDAVNAVFAPIFGEAFVPLRAGRSDSADGPPVELLLADTDGLADFEEPGARGLGPTELGRRAEARLLAARLDQLIEAGEAAPGEIVVLLRAGSNADIYETAIRDRGYTTLSASGEGFYARPEIGDLIAYLRALANPHDDLALYGALASPLCAADADELVALGIAARGSASTATAMAELEVPRIRAFAGRFAAARQAARSQPLDGVVAGAIADNGYELYLAQLPSPERRIANLRKLIRLARQFEQDEGRDLRRFADALSAGRVGARHEPEAPPPLSGAIRLMSIHAAKGLEFPVVALADLGSQPPNQAPRILADERRVGLRLPNVERARAAETLDYHALLGRLRESEAAEERRVHYVAMTRARERLILSGTIRFENWQPASCAAAWLARGLVADVERRALGPPTVGELVEGSDGVAVRLTLARAGVAPAPAGRAAAAAVAEPVATASRAPAALRPAVESRLSYTALAQYESCGYRYYLQRVLALPDVDPPEGPSARGRDAAARGVLVHGLLEELDFADPRPPDPVRIATAARELGIELSSEATAEIATLAGAIADSPLCARLAAAGRLEREQAFAFALDGELLRGLIDVSAVEHDGTLLIVDYKTDRIEGGETLESRIERDYSLQRLVYGLAGLRSGARRVEVAHCFLRAPAEPISAVFDADQLAALEDELRARIEPLQAGRFKVTREPGYGRCASCPGRARLCSYDATLTLRAPLF
jgi:ATP-dependent exoDNAse (exonuclease V) beta subunit